MALRSDHHSSALQVPSPSTTTIQSGDYHVSCQQPTKSVTEDGVVVELNDIGDHLELEEEVGVGSPTPGDIKVGEAVGKEYEPNEYDDHRMGQMAQGVHGGVKTRSKLRYSGESVWYIY